jgi:DNA-binding transcriptional regulator of glucitol operon
MTQARAIIAAVAAVALVLLLAIGWFQWRAAKDAKARAEVAEQGQALAEQTTGIIERTVRTEVVVRQEAERQVDVVQSAPGADARLDPAFRDTLRGSLGVMRGEPQAPDDQRAPDPEGSLP